MRIAHRTLNRFAQRITIATVLFLVCIGALLVIAQLKPFWLDEWFIIYNLKTKDTAGLLGKLDLMQQFPRVYLVLMKWFTSFFNYSYFSLRFPSFVLGLGVIGLSYSMMKKIYPSHVFARYLFVLILISSFTFTEYFVQSKQYTMDIFMSVFALWQISELRKLQPGIIINKVRYLALCSSFLIFPFFSYTYPIVIAPVYVIACLQIIRQLRSSYRSFGRVKMVSAQLFPLLLCSVSIFLFYLMDVKQLMADGGMHGFWNFLMFDGNHKVVSLASRVYRLFSQLGAGIIFENLMGVVGVSAFIYGLYSCIQDLRGRKSGLEVQLRLYSCLLLLLTLALFVLRKLPLGDPRLNAFTMPSIAILNIHLIRTIAVKVRWEIPKVMLPAILYLSLAGNVFSTYINFFLNAGYKKQLSIYVATENAIILAQNRKIPIFITKDVSYPYQVEANSNGVPGPISWVVKTFPAYKMDEHLLVYGLEDLASAKGCLDQLPGSIASAIAGDGMTFHIVERGTKKLAHNNRNQPLQQVCK